LWPSLSCREERIPEENSLMMCMTCPVTGKTHRCFVLSQDSNEWLNLITGVHSGELTWADASHKAESLKINKQILSACLADIAKSSHAHS